MTNILTVDSSGNVTASGDDAAANLSGTNTGDQSDATLNFSDITTNNSSTSQHGFLKKLDNNSAHYMDGTGNWSTPPAPGLATTSVAGIVQPDGATIDVSGGVISVPTATTSALGLVQPDGSTIDISSGVISVATATTSQLGAVQPDGATIDISSGVISVPTATTSVLGLVKTDGSTLTNSSGAIAVATATTSQLGAVKPDGSTIDVSSGVISVPTATTSTLGLVKPDGSTIDISGGVISAVNEGTVTSVTFTGDGTVLSSTPSSAVTSSGTVTASLANAGAGTVLGNNGSTSAAPAYTAAPVLGKNATTAGTLGLANGGASGTTITIQNLGSTSAYNFNLPATAGSSGAPLVSGGGSSTSMSWGSVTGSGNFAMSASPTFTGTITAASINASGAVVAGVSSLSIVSGAIATNAALGNYFYVQLASGSTTMSAPSNATDGQVITYELEQPSSGSNSTVSWNAAFDFGTPGVPTLSTTNGAYDLVGFRYSARKSAWLYLGSQLGF